jgi:ubiquinone/menaquinone biosynthesis C-methylase UbiE
MGLTNIVKRALRLPANMLVGSSSNLSAKVIDSVGPWLRDSLGSLAIEEPVIAAKFFPDPWGPKGYVLDSVTDSPGSHKSGLPVPPQDLIPIYYVGSVQTFLEGGRTHVQIMRDLVAQSNFPIQAGYRLLDLGCGAGRMIRHFEDLAEECEIWGVDIGAKSINWCQQHLSPPFRFATTTTFPHLPFEDHYFDFIYCGSVFTHISDLVDAWLLELRRITRPHGRIYITIHDKHTIDYLREKYPEHPLLNTFDEFHKTSNTKGNDYAMIVTVRGPGGSQVFYDIDFIRQRWGRFFGILSVTQEAYGGQTAILLER